jgi:hypothetical protein
MRIANTAAATDPQSLRILSTSLQSLQRVLAQWGRIARSRQVSFHAHDGVEIATRKEPDSVSGELSGTTIGGGELAISNAPAMRQTPVEEEWIDASDASPTVRHVMTNFVTEDGDHAVIIESLQQGSAKLNEDGAFIRRMGQGIQMMRRAHLLKYLDGSGYAEALAGCTNEPSHAGVLLVRQQLGPPEPFLPHLLVVTRRWGKIAELARQSSQELRFERDAHAIGVEIRHRCAGVHTRSLAHCPAKDPRESATD